jgi:hypothetical protein
MAAQRRIPARGRSACCWRNPGLLARRPSRESDRPRWEVRTPAQPGGRCPSPAGETGTLAQLEWRLLGPAGMEEGYTGPPGQLGKPWTSREVAAPAQPAYGFTPARFSGNPAWASMCRPEELYSGLGEYNPAQACCLTIFLISCTYNLIYNI